MAESLAKREEVQKELVEKPFMPIDRRKKLKKELPIHDAKIRRLKLDITTVEMLSKISQDQLDNPKIPAHFQDQSRKDK